MLAATLLRLMADNQGLSIPKHHPSAGSGILRHAQAYILNAYQGGLVNSGVLPPHACVSQPHSDAIDYCAFAVAESFF